MKRKGELYHVIHPHRSKINWIIFYLVILACFFASFYLVASHIRTRGIVTGKIEINTPFSKYLIGEDISFTIKNGYNTTIFVTNKCPEEPVAIYFREDNTWKRIHGTATKSDCSFQERQVQVPANSFVTVSLSPWHNLFTQVGQYRLVSVVNGFDELPFVDFEIISPPPVVVASGNSTSTKAQSTGQGTQRSGASSQSSSPTTTVTQSKTVIVHVSSNGIYDNLSINLNVGDSIQFIYSPPIDEEVRTRFTAVSPTVTAISSVTLDEEYTTRTKIFSSAGKWSFRADDHSGNTGTLTVN